MPLASPNSLQTQPPGINQQTPPQFRDPYTVPESTLLGSGENKVNLLGTPSTPNAPAQSYGLPGSQMPSAYTAPQLLGGHKEENEDPLRLSDVIASVYSAFPEIQAARLQRQVAAGEVTSAWGAYDTKLQGYTLNEPTGFYRNFRHGIGVARQTWWGGYAAAGYRVGRGDFQPWYKERETNEGGEFKLAFAQPLLAGRAIDPQRVALFQASLGRQAADPQVQQAILDSSHEATAAFWKWVAAGLSLDAQQELLNLALQRGRQLETGVRETLFAEVELVLNNQLIAERTAKAFEMQQKYVEAAVKLSLFLRDENGQPIVPNYDWIPLHFPQVQPVGGRDFATDFTNAQARLPEPVLLRLEMRSVQLDNQLACNELLPRIDAIAEASQDVGLRASSSNDKGQFELLVGVQGEVPLQLRKARGKIVSTNAKLAQLNQKYQFVQNKIAANLKASYSALVAAEQMIKQSEQGLQLAVDTLARFQYGFNQGFGKVDLIYINILETKLTETELKLIDAQTRWFIALGDMQTALGLNPLDQAMALAQLPISKLPGPGSLPQPQVPTAEELQQMFQQLEQIRPQVPGQAPGNLPAGPGAQQPPGAAQGAGNLPAQPPGGALQPGVGQGQSPVGQVQPGGGQGQPPVGRVQPGAGQGQGQGQQN